MLTADEFNKLYRELYEQSTALNGSWTMLTHVVLDHLKAHYMNKGDVHEPQKIMDELSQIAALTAHMDAEWAAAERVKPASGISEEERRRIALFDNKESVRLIKGRLELTVAMALRLLRSLPTVREECGTMVFPKGVQP